MTKENIQIFYPNINNEYNNIYYISYSNVIRYCNDEDDGYIYFFDNEKNLESLIHDEYYHDIKKCYHK